MSGYKSKSTLGFTWEKIGFVKQLRFGDKVIYTRCGEIHNFLNFTWRW